MRGIKHISQGLNCIDFNDARIQGVEISNGKALILLQDWREKTIRLRFSGVVYFKAFEFGSDLSQVVVNDDTEEIKEALRVILHDGGHAEGYPDLVQVSFLSNAPIMIVIFDKFVNES